jgi:hypothetical protein
MFNVKPMYQTRANVAMIDVGIEMAAMTVDRKLPRNRKTTNAARNDPTMRCSWTLRNDASMNSAWSRTIRSS